MESDSLRAAQQLADLERQRLGVFTMAAPPVWMWWVLGAGIAGFLVTYDFKGNAWRIAAPAVYALFIAAWTGLLIRRTGAQTRFCAQPVALRRVLYRAWGASFVLAAVAVAIGFAWTFIAAAVVGGVGFAVGGPMFARAYQAQAARLVAQIPTP